MRSYSKSLPTISVKESGFELHGTATRQIVKDVLVQARLVLLEIVGY